MQSKILSVVIPIKNEEEILWDNASTLAKIFNQLVGIGQWDFIFINNNSTDNTDLILKKISTTWPSSKTVFESIGGYSPALRSGLSHIDTPFVFITDIENWDIPFIIWAWKNRNEFDLLIGSKRLDPTINKQPLYRRLLSCGLNSLLRFMFQFSGSDTHGQKLIRMKNMKNIIDQCEMKLCLYDTEMVLRTIRAGHSIAEAAVASKEIRPARNFMIEKIIRNLLGVVTLYYHIRKLPFKSSSRYKCFFRKDILTEYSTYITNE